MLRDITAVDVEHLVPFIEAWDGQVCWSIWCHPGNNNWHALISATLKTTETVPPLWSDAFSGTSSVTADISFVAKHITVGLLFINMHPLKYNVVLFFVLSLIRIPKSKVCRQENVPTHTDKHTHTHTHTHKKEKEKQKKDMATSIIYETARIFDLSTK